MSKPVALEMGRKQCMRMPTKLTACAFTTLQERDERVEHSDDEGEDLLDGAERDYVPVPELDTYEEDQVLISTKRKFVNRSS